MRAATVACMESEASWAMLALALGLVLALTAVVVWLSVTEVRAVRPAPATVRPGGRRLRQGAAAKADRYEAGTADGREDGE